MKLKNSIQLILFSILIFIYSCNSKKIEITSEYIINENWSKRNEDAGANSITIQKMKVRNDSIIDPFLELSQAEILSKLEEDSSFMHYANVRIKQGESYKGKRIYFNSANEFSWGSKSRFNNDDKTKTIGNLQPGNWYKFSHLVTHPYYVYVYIDSTKEVHRFDVNLSNY